MKRLIIILCGFLYAGWALEAQPAYRFTYTFQYKVESEGNYRLKEMKLDYDGKTSFFYDENRFLKDSLICKTFDKNGNTVDEDAYAKATRLPVAHSFCSVSDFSRDVMSHYYTEVAFFKGEMPSSMPAWELKPEQKEVAGYDCRKAECTFLGRRWSVWYTEELPIPVGPWFLWGAPGLVVHASDEEQLFIFRLLSAEQSEVSRLNNWISYYDNNAGRHNAIVFDYPMKQMERIHSRYERDVDYFNSVHGISGGYVLDRSGNRIDEPTTFPYIPLIPDAYWK